MTYAMDFFVTIELIILFLTLVLVAIRPLIAIETYKRMITAFLLAGGASCVVIGILYTLTRLWTEVVAK